MNLRLAIYTDILVLAYHRPPMWLFTMLTGWRSFFNPRALRSLHYNVSRWWSE